MVAFFFCVLFFSAFYALPSMACVAEQREYDGSCIDGTSSSGSPGQTFGRLGTSNPNWDSSAAPTGDALPNNGQQTMLTISFLEFILLDIIGFDASAYVNNTSPKMYQNIETSWIDGSHVYGHDKNSAPIKAVSGNFSGYIDLDAVAAKFAGQNQGVQFWANVTVDFHNKIIDVYNQYDLVGSKLSLGTYDATLSERFEFARFCTVYWLQNLVATGLLPSFFNGGEAYNTNGFTQQSFPYYTQGYFTNTSRPVAQIPLAAVVGVLATLRPGMQDLTLDATCIPANIAYLASTDAQGFGSPPLNSETEYSNAQALSVSLPIANYSELYYQLLGTYPDPVNEPSQNFFSIIHNHNPCATTACDATALGVSSAAENAPHAAAAYAADQLSHVDFTSNYHPLALALTFGVVRQAYVEDSYNWDIMFSSAAGAASPPWSVGLHSSTNIFGDLLQNACDFSSGCDSTAAFFTNQINYGLSNYAGFMFQYANTYCNQMIKDSGNCPAGACGTCDCM
jgi:hypothetical protein